MTSLKLLALLSLTALLTACATTPLPEGDPPVDFYVRFIYERSPGEAAKPLPENVEQATPEQVLTSMPSYVKFTIDAGGAEYEARFDEPRPAEKSGTIDLPRRQFQQIYDVVQQADLYGMEDFYDGDNPAQGKRTYEVIGKAKLKHIEVTGMRVPELDAMIKKILEIVPPDPMSRPPEKVKSAVIMDLRTLEFHRYDSPRVKDIPEEHRKEFPDQYAALNAGGFPAREMTGKDKEKPEKPEKPDEK